MNRQRQRGAALMMGLMLLLVLTMLAVAAVNMSTVNLRIVGNMQATQQAEAAVNYAIETALLTPANFTTNRNGVLSVTTSVGTVSLGPRKCLYSSFSMPNQEFSAGVTPVEYATWQVSATYTDPLTNAQTTIVRGVRIVMPGNGNCMI